VYNGLPGGMQKMAVKELLQCHCKAAITIAEHAAVGKIRSLLE
jgi:hypothetical protein